MQRQTPQRRAIREVFEEAGRPLDVGEALERARRTQPRLGIATVYRAVHDLVEAGFLQPVELPGEPLRYERADLAHHHHFRCTVCDRVFDIAGCALGPTPKVPPGFEVESHEVILYGRCPECGEGEGG